MQKRQSVYNEGLL